MAAQAEVASMKGYKALGGLAADEIATTVTALTRLGGANGYMEVPMWADTLLGIYTHASQEIVTADEDTQIWGYLESADGMGIKPFEFLYPPMGVSEATSFAADPTPGEYYPMNAPVRPGSRLIAYAQVMSAITGVTHPGITFWFSNSRASGDWAPTSLDSRPGIQRYRKVGAWTVVLTGAADAWSPEAAYQIGLGSGGGVITELGGVMSATVATAATPGVGIFRFRSNDVPLFPQEFHNNAFGSYLGAVGGHLGLDTITRRQCHVEGESVVQFENEFQQGGGLAIATHYFCTMVEYIRGV